MTLKTLSGTAVKALMAALVLAACGGCYLMRPSSGGGQAKVPLPRSVDASDIALPTGYRIEPVVTGLTFPTGVTFDDQSRIYVVEAGYSYGEAWTTPRLLRFEPDGRLTTVAEGGTNGPWTGAVFHQGNFYVVEGGAGEGGRVVRVGPKGERTVLVENLPSLGDHHSNGPVVDSEGWLVFGQGTASNSGVVGPDNAKFGWLSRHPDFHDIPGQDIVLSGRNFNSRNALRPGDKTVVTTGAFLPYGQPSTQGQVIRGQVPCSGSILRVRPDGSGLQLVAWGFRNPFGLAYSPDGKLFVTENSYDDRGSRPVWGTGDVLWQVTPGLWHGWPDFAGGLPLTDPQFKPPGKTQPDFLLSQHPNTPPKPKAILGVHASACGFDFSRSSRFGYEGQAFIALFGDQAPEVGKVLHPVGYKVVRVNTATGEIEPFAENKGKVSGPASKLKSGGLERPVSARFSPNGETLYVVDFGVLQMSKRGSHPKSGTGVLWKITRSTR